MTKDKDDAQFDVVTRDLVLDGLRNGAPVKQEKEVPIEERGKDTVPVAQPVVHPGGTQIGR